jgi:hypothetical protein
MIWQKRPLDNWRIHILVIISVTKYTDIIE